MTTGRPVEYKQLIHAAFSDRATIEWDDSGKTATVYFLADDATAIFLAIPEATLRDLQADISQALADRKPPTPNP